MFNRALIAISLIVLSLSLPSWAMADAIGDIIEESKSLPAKTIPAPPSPAPEPEVKTAALPRSTSLPTIVIDPGHGGKDTGAIGYRQLREKDVVLDISKKLAQAIQESTGATVVLTREKDQFITLDKRDEIAIARKADLFISVHANAASRQEAAGIEIYYLNNATDEASERLAKRENRASRKSGSAAEEIISNIVLNDNTVYSQMLAEKIHHSIAKKMAKKYNIDRLQIKSALFYVLVGSKTPSILLETGFVTNPQEAERLKQPAYQDDLVKAVSAGVSDYFKMLKTKEWAL